MWKKRIFKSHQARVAALRNGISAAIRTQGGFFVFVDASHLSTDSYKLAFDILEKAHVGAASGFDFGEMGEGYRDLLILTQSKIS